ELQALPRKAPVPSSRAGAFRHPPLPRGRAPSLSRTRRLCVTAQLAAVILCKEPVGASVINEKTRGPSGRDAVGMLVEGVWQDRWYDTESTGGRFVRSSAPFRNWITADGSPGPTGRGGFKAEPGRYHLYVSLACPWAHRTLIMRKLKGLEEAIGVSVVHWEIRDHGWEFRRGPGATGDDLYGFDYLYQIYTLAKPDYTGRVSVPVLWDKERQTIVNNESAEIIRMLNSAFDEVGATGEDYYPEPLRAEID